MLAEMLLCFSNYEAMPPERLNGRILQPALDAPFQFFFCLNFIFWKLLFKSGQNDGLGHEIRLCQRGPIAFLHTLNTVFANRFRCKGGFAGKINSHFYFKLKRVSNHILSALVKGGSLF